MGRGAAPHAGEPRLEAEESDPVLGGAVQIDEFIHAQAGGSRDAGQVRAVVDDSDTVFRWWFGRLVGEVGNRHRCREERERKGVIPGRRWRGENEKKGIRPGNEFHQACMRRRLGAPQQSEDVGRKARPQQQGDLADLDQALPRHRADNPRIGSRSLNGLRANPVDGIARP